MAEKSISLNRFPEQLLIIIKKFVQYLHLSRFYLKGWNWVHPKWMWALSIDSLEGEHWAEGGLYEFFTAAVVKLAHT